MLWDSLRPAPLPTPAPEAQLVTAREAWAVMQVRSATVRKWASRGYLQKAGHRGREALYDRADLERVHWRTHARTNTSPAWPELDVPPHYYRRLITTTEAARLLGVAPSTVRSWVTRGHLEPCGRRRRSHLFTVGSVLTAGRRTAS
ncbi:helix-turn-helix domain-containing protein [Nocardia salmonicida]